MALGSYDANGIWHYGESDNIALFSDTLNKLADSASSAITADRSRLASLEAGSLSGLIPIKPTSVDKSGGTASVNTLGLITLTNVTSFTVNGVFSSSYARYRVVFTVTGCTTTANIYLRYAAAGIVNSSTGYSYDNIYHIAGASVSADGGNGVANMTAGAVYLGASAGVAATYVYEFTNQAIAGPSMHMFSGGASVSGAGRTDTGFGTFNNNNVFDGFNLYPSGGNINATVQVFGYND